LFERFPELPMFRVEGADGYVYGERVTAAIAHELAELRPGDRLTFTPWEFAGGEWRLREKEAVSSDG
jgi:hypothetical protein